MALYIKHGDWPMVDSIWPFIKWIATALVHLAGHYMAPKPLYGSKLPLYLPRYFQDLYRARKWKLGCHEKYEKKTTIIILRHRKATGHCQRKVWQDGLSSPCKELNHHAGRGSDNNALLNITIVAIAIVALHIVANDIIVILVASISHSIITSPPWIIRNEDKDTDCWS